MVKPAVFPYTQEFLQHRFHYDPETGKITHRNPLHKQHKGKEAGYTNTQGYVQLRIDRKAQYAHRAIWVYVYGIEPEGYIDHKNGDKSDNRLENLRIISNRENQCNQKIHREGKLPGCRLMNYNHNKNFKYHAYITIAGKRKHLGVYSTEIEAHNAYMQYRKDHSLD